jgi:hypothetical protein
MTSLLSSIVGNLVRWIETGAIDVINALIVAVAVFIRGLFALLPAMPTFPTLPGDLTWFYWLVPVATIAAALTTAALLYVAVLVVTIAARWVKLL